MRGKARVRVGVSAIAIRFISAGTGQSGRASERFVRRSGFLGQGLERVLQPHERRMARMMPPERAPRCAIARLLLVPGVDRDLVGEVVRLLDCRVDLDIADQS